MPNTIDILCAIDANFLMSEVEAGRLQAGTLDNPTNLGAWGSSDTYIFLISDGQYADNNQGKSELTIDANVGDVVRWRATNPSLGLSNNTATPSYSSMLYNFHVLEGSGVMSAPELLVTPTNMFINSRFDSKRPTEIGFLSAAWYSNVLNIGNVTYTWSFQVIDNRTGSQVGFFTWDPFIHVAK